MRTPIPRLLALVALLSVLVPSFMTAQRTTPSGPSLGSFLNPDGTLNLSSGYSGSLDANGWRLASGPDGAPRFESISGDEHWDDRFGPPGTNGPVYAIAISGPDIYIGGQFTTAGTVVTSNVARWNSTSKIWSEVGGGLGGTVYALAISGDEIYAGGIFKNGSNNGYVARWNPSLSEWDILGNQGIIGRFTPDFIPGAYVYALAVLGDDVYIGGQFDTVETNLHSPNLVKWSRRTGRFTGISAVGVVRSMLVSGGRLYVAGTLADIAGVTVNHVAMYDSTSKAWSTLGPGLNGTANALAISGTSLYVGGEFTTAGGSPAVNIARWNGSAWSPLAGGIARPVRALTMVGADLYAGSEITTAGSVVVNGIVRWNGAAFAPVGIGVGDNVAPSVNALASDGSLLYLGGRFATAGTLTSQNVAGWDTEEYFQLGRNALKEMSRNGTNGAVFAVAVNGPDVYIGGDFTRAGGIDAKYIVRWNATNSSWSPLGSGIGGPAPFVRAIAVSGSDLYVGGIFTTAGGNAAPGIARWNGSTWSSVGGGVGGSTPYVFSIVASGSVVYVGGAFTTAGSTPANRIARWDGSAWSALGTGIGAAAGYSSVNAIAIKGSDLYAGGDFTLAGGATANRIARWNGTAWSALGLGTNAPVSALVVYNDSLVAGGEFTLAGGITVGFLARWNGTAWSALGGAFNHPVRALAVGSGALYAGGEFTAAGADVLGRIGRWNGTAWTPLQVGAIGNGVNGPVRAIAIGAGPLYTGGEFSIAGGLRANNIAEWEGTIWSSLGSDPTAGLQGPVLAMALKDTSIYIAGLFTSAGGMKAGGIARWDGNNWIRLGRGVNGPARALAVVGNDVYVGGEFDSAGTVRAVGVARWDGATWSPLGAGLGGPIPYAYALAARGTTLYVGGAFATAGGLGARRIAQYNTATQSWSAIGSGIGGAPFFTYVSALATASTGELYAGGIFPTVGDVTVNNVARWNGTAWSDLGGGINNAVFALAVDANDAVIVGGSFTAAGGIAANNIARWKGGAWEELGEGLAGDVNTLGFYDNDLFAGGSFTSSGGVGVNHVGRWNGVEWITMGGGVEKDLTVGRALTLATYKDGVYVGGDFTIAGGHPSLYFGHWRRTPFLGVATSSAASASLQLRSYPNPFGTTTELTFTLPESAHTTLTISTMQGNLIATPIDGAMPHGEHRIRWDASAFGSGTYVYRLQSGGTMASGLLHVVR